MFAVSAATNAAPHALCMRYVICMMEHRLRVLLDDERYQKIARAAERRGVSVAAVIREAIDRLPIDDETRRTATNAVLAATPMPLPADPAELRREIDAAHARRSA